MLGWVIISLIDFSKVYVNFFWLSKKIVKFKVITSYEMFLVVRYYCSFLRYFCRISLWKYFTLSLKQGLIFLIWLFKRLLFGYDERWKRGFFWGEFLKEIFIAALDFMESILEVVLDLKVLNGLIVVSEKLGFERSQLILIETELMVFVFGFYLFLLEL